MLHGWSRCAIFLTTLVLVGTTVSVAAAVQPLRPQVARCKPAPLYDSGTQGSGNVAAGRKLDLEFRWALGDVNDSPQAEIDQTTRVEVCWTSQAEDGIAQCPGQSGDDAWIIYRASPPLGSLPSPSNVQNPNTSLSAEGVYFTLPVDWDSVADRNKILFIVVNQTVQQGQNLLIGQNANLAQGGFCGAPTRIEPGTAGTSTSPNEHFVVYAAPSDFPLPVGWTLKYPGVCDPDSVAACPGSGCVYGFDGSLGPCLRRASVTFWRARLSEIDVWHKDFVQGGVPGPVKLENWWNGFAAVGSTCGATGQRCPTRSIWIPFKGAGTGSDGVNWTTQLGFLQDPVIPLSTKAAFPFRNLAHEYFHSLQRKWANRAGATSGFDAWQAFYAHALFLEGTADMAQLGTCVTSYPGNPNGDSVPASKCVSPHTLYWNTFPSVDQYVEFPGGNYLESYAGFWFYRYAAEQFAVPWQRPGQKAHTASVTSVSQVQYDSVTNQPRELNVRRPDEGFDLIGYLLRAFDPSQTGNGCSFPSSSPSAYSMLDRADCAMKQVIGRGFDDLMLDFHTMLVLKDYKVNDPRWTPEWLGDFNAGSATRLWNADPTVGLTAAKLPHAPLPSLRPYVLASGAGYPKKQTDLMPDGVHRALRVQDTYACSGPSCGTITVNTLAPGATMSSPITQSVGAYRAAYVSIHPDPGWSGTELEVWAKPVAGNPRFRVFTIDSNGVAKLASQCVSPSKNVADECSPSAADQGKVRVPITVNSSVYEVLLVASAGSEPAKFDWQLGPEASQLTIISPTSAKPALIGAPMGGDKRPFVLMFTAKDSNGCGSDGTTNFRSLDPPQRRFRRGNRDRDALASVA